MSIENIKFIRSAADKKDFIQNNFPQITFAGRSNVGKSSVINTLVRRKNLARIGATPGKTAHVNYYQVGDGVYLTDLPGYGYAKVPKSERDRWGRLMEAYFAGGFVTLGILIVDARHKPTQDDVTMFDWFKNTGCPVIVVANKVDKVKKSELSGNIELIRETLDIGSGTEIVPFSAETGAGREALLRLIEKYVSL